MKEYQIKVTSVDYCVEWEDVDDGKEHTNEWYEKKIAKVKSSLPQELDLEITCDPEDLDDMVSDAISDETDWLINSCTYDIVDEEDVEDDEPEERQIDYFNIEIEVLEDDSGKWVYLANDGSSGCKYNFKTKQQLTDIVKEYVEDLIHFEYEDDETN